MTAATLALSYLLYVVGSAYIMVHALLGTNPRLRKGGK